MDLKPCKKRHFLPIVILCAVLLGACLSVPAVGWLYCSLRTAINVDSQVKAPYFESGDGSEISPYEIKYPVQLYYFAWLQNMGYFNETDKGQTQDVPPTYFYLSQDLDMTGFILPPVGTAEYPFIGSFDGKGHTVSNLKVQNQAPNTEPEEGLTDIPEKGPSDPQIVGFFGVIGNYPGSATTGSTVATVTNFNLDNVTIRTLQPKGSQSLIGIVSGYVNGEVSKAGVINSKIQIAEGISSLSGGETQNLSDTTLVGYCTPEFRDNQDIVTVKVAKPTAMASSFVDTGNGKNWGDSIPMKDIYKRLEAVFHEAINPQYHLNGYLQEYAHLRIELYELAHEHNNNPHDLHYNTFGGYHYEESPSPFPSFARKSSDGKTKADYGVNVQVPGFGPNLWGVNLDSTAGSYSFSRREQDSADTTYMYLSGEDLDARPTKVNIAEDRQKLDAYYISHTAEDGNTYYLALNEKKNGLICTTDYDTATPWVFIPESGNMYYVGMNGIKYYLNADPYLNVSSDQSGAGATAWKKTDNPDGSFTLSFTYSGIANFRLVWSEQNKMWATSCDKGDGGDSLEISGLQFSAKKGQQQYWFVGSLKDGIPTTSTSSQRYDVDNSNLPTSPWILKQYLFDGRVIDLDITKLDGNNSFGIQSWEHVVISADFDGITYYLTDDLKLSSDLTQAARWALQGYGSHTYTFQNKTTQAFLKINSKNQFEMATGVETNSDIQFQVEKYPLEIKLPNDGIPATAIPTGKAPGTDKNLHIKLPLYNLTEQEPVSSAATNSTYFPLSIVDHQNPFGNDGGNLEASAANTGYIVSGIHFRAETFPYQSGDIRVSKYPIQESLNNSIVGESYNAGSVRILTKNARTDSGTYNVLSDISGESVTVGGQSFTTKTPDDLGYGKYAHAKETLDKLLGDPNEPNAYGLHFMNSQISKQNTIIAPTVRMNGFTDTNVTGTGIYQNFQLPEDCIDFTLQDRGFINFVAGSYYPENNSFFSLHHIIREKTGGDLVKTDLTVPLYDRFAHKIVDVTQIPAKDNPWKMTTPTKENPWMSDFYKSLPGLTKTVSCYAIKEIKEIKEIYQQPGGEKEPYVYKYTDGSLSIEGVDLTKCTLVFDTEWLTDPQNMVQNALYYFEIPVNAGEYALGSVSDGASLKKKPADHPAPPARDGAYLLYLDISASAAMTHRIETTEITQTITDSFDYPRGVSLGDGSNSRPAFGSLPGPGILYSFTRDELGTARLTDTNGNVSCSGKDLILKDTQGNWAVSPIHKKTVTQKKVTWTDYNNSDHKTTTRIATLTWTDENGAVSGPVKSYRVSDPDTGQFSEAVFPPEDQLSTAFPQEISQLASYHYGFDTQRSGTPTEITVANTFRLNDFPSISEIKPLFPKVREEPKDISQLLTDYTITVNARATEPITLYMDSLTGSTPEITINGSRFQAGDSLTLPAS